MSTKTETLPMNQTTSTPSSPSLPQYAAEKLREATRRAEASVARMKKKVQESAERPLPVDDPHPTP